MQDHHLRDRSKIKLPVRYQANIAELKEPTTYEQAVSGEDAQLWKGAIKEELDAHNNNSTWRLTSLPKDKTIIGCR